VTVKAQQAWCNIRGKRRSRRRTGSAGLLELNQLPRSVSESNYGYYEDPKALDIYEKMLHETDLEKQRALMLQYNERVLDEEAHYIHSFGRIGWCRCVLTFTAGRSARATTPTRIWQRFGSAYLARSAETLTSPPATARDDKMRHGAV
jgi:hypothetical protein